MKELFYYEVELLSSAKPPRESVLLPPRVEFGHVGAYSHLQEGLTCRVCT